MVKAVAEKKSNIKKKNPYIKVVIAIWPNPLISRAIEVTKKNIKFELAEIFGFLSYVGYIQKQRPVVTM